MSLFRAVLVLFGILSVALPQASGQLLQPENASTTEKDTLQTSSNSRWGKEDWTRLPLAESGLNLSQYVSVIQGHTETENYTRDEIRVQWRLSDPFDIYVVLPKGVKNPPAILYIYDYRFSSDRFRDDGWCTRVTKGGVAAVGFTSYLSFERRDYRPMKEWFVSQLQEALGSSTHDVQMVLNYLASRGDIDMGRIGIFGQGSGGAIAVLAASVDKRISAVDLLDPWGDWPDWLKYSRQVPEDERSRYLTPEFLQSVSGMDPVKVLGSIPAPHVRVQQLMDDQVTPTEVKLAISAAVHPPQIDREFKDATEHAAEWQKSGVAGWLREQLAQLGPQ
jgi:acetyl esterase/lipase